MGGLFGGGGGTVVQAATPPKIEDPEVQEAIRRERELARRRRGRQQTILTGPQGLPDTETKKKTLLGG